MTPEQTQLRLIRGEIASLPEADQQGIRRAAEQLRELLMTHNHHGQIALALVGAELAAE